MPPQGSPFCNLRRFGLVLIGTDKTDNDLDYDYVTAYRKGGLHPADWELVNLLDQHIKGINAWHICLAHFL